MVLFVVGKSANISTGLNPLANLATVILASATSAAVEMACTTSTHKPLTPS